MVKELKFNIKMVVDGKEQLATATTSVAELRKKLETVKDKATRLRELLVTLITTPAGQWLLLLRKVLSSYMARKPLAYLQHMGRFHTDHNGIPSPLLLGMVFL